MDSFWFSIDGLLNEKRKLQHIMMLRLADQATHAQIFEVLKRGYQGEQRIKAMILINKHIADDKIIERIGQINKEIDLRLERAYTPT